MILEQLIETVRQTASRRAFLYDDELSYAGGIEEALQALASMLADVGVGGDLAFSA